ncbi:MAG: hypothetical protein ABIJ05_01070 [Patescibacteria group bacterium]
MIEKDLKACVSGSFDKFKPEIDLAIDELNELGVTVLSPSKGWLYKPSQRIFNPKEDKFRPLPSETGMGIKEIEDDFLSNVKKSDFLYVINPEGYIGNVVGLEIGFAIASGIPVFLQQKINPLIIENDSIWQEIEPKLKVCSIEEAITQIKK